MVLMIVVGLISERKWLGTNGMEHVRTVREPKQAIPTFEQTIALLMQVSDTTFAPLSSPTFVVAGEPARQVQR
jgi:hypothetical protein